MAVQEKKENFSTPELIISDVIIKGTYGTEWMCSATQAEQAG